MATLASPVLSREVLEKALEGQSAENLQEMGRRLERSKDGMSEMLALEEDERSSLQQESEDLNATIDLMMKELHKLNIGAMNIVDPRLDEGPLAFVGRYWDKVKPRDTAFQTSEHVGEIKKPIITEGIGVPPTAQEVAHQVKEQAGKQVLETATRLQGKLGPLWQRTQGFINEKQGELTSAPVWQRTQGFLNERQGELTSAPVWQRTQGFLNERQGELSGAVTRAQARAQAKAKDLEVAYPTLWQSVKAAATSMQEGTEKKPAHAKTKKRTPKQPRAEEPTSEGGNLAAAAERQSPDSTAGSASSTAPGPPAPEEPTAEAPAAAVIADVSQASAGAPTLPDKTQESAPESAAGGAGADEEIDSTLLIEAKITIADGSVLTLHVKAADRCKEVAQRFVQDNSLKAWFQDPLTTWLKKVEADAVTFPVKVEGDLGEIRKQHSKAKNKA